LNYLLLRSKLLTAKGVALMKETKLAPELELPAALLEVFSLFFSHGFVA